MTDEERKQIERAKNLLLQANAENFKVASIPQDDEDPERLAIRAEAVEARQTAINEAKDILQALLA